MKLEVFKKFDQKPLGAGEDKEAFIDPTDNDRVISVIKEKEGREKGSANKLKGAFYLTKIAHLLIPEHVPEIYQAGESADGQQILDREHIKYPIGKEDDAELNSIGLKLSHIGFGFNIDENYGNYKKDEKGDVKYLEEFMPWRVDDLDPGKLEFLFDEEALKQAIEQAPDPATKILCKAYYERLMALCEEESVRQKIKSEAIPPIDYTQEIKELEQLFESFESKHSIEALNAIKTEKEADESEERKSAKDDLIPITNLLRKYKQDPFDSLRDRYRVCSRAVGMINGGLVDHNRG